MYRSLEPDHFFYSPVRSLTYVWGNLDPVDHILECFQNLGQSDLFHVFANGIGLESLETGAWIEFVQTVDNPLLCP